MAAEAALAAGGPRAWNDDHLVTIEPEQMLRYARAVGDHASAAESMRPLFGSALALPALERAAETVIPSTLRPRGLHASVLGGGRAEFRSRHAAPLIYGTPPPSYIISPRGARLAGVPKRACDELS